MEECPQSKGNCTELPNSTSEGEDAYLTSDWKAQTAIDQAILHEEGMDDDLELPTTC